MFCIEPSAFSYQHSAIQCSCRSVKKQLHILCFARDDNTLNSEQFAQQRTVRAIYLDGTIAAAADR